MRNAPIPTARLHASASDIIDEARNGRIFVLIDGEGQGVLAVPAQFATPEAINFMARHGRGLICLAMAKARADALALGPMQRSDPSSRDLAFTVSIEAREGVTTGISAADRARTVAVAINSGKGRDEIVTPGHVFPIVVREGGILTHAGAAEAALDTARLAGLNPSGVFCQILGEDGALADESDLVAFAQRHNLLIGTIRDLVAFRRRRDHLVETLARIGFDSEWGGAWEAVTYRNRATCEKTVALVKGRIDPRTPTLVRLHPTRSLADMFGERSPRASLISAAMGIIAREGKGIVILVDGDTVDAAGRAAEAGDMAPPQPYAMAAQILADLGAEDITLLVEADGEPGDLEAYGLSIAGTRAIAPARR